MVNSNVANITSVVKDYDAAIAFYIRKLGFVLLEDTRLSDTKRWLLVTPTSDSKFSLLLANPDTPEQKMRIGNQTGGRVFLFLNTDDF